MLTFFCDYLAARRDVATNVFPFHAFNTILIVHASSGFENSAREFRERACEAARGVALDPSEWWKQSARLITRSDVAKSIADDVVRLRVDTLIDQGLEADSSLTGEQWKPALAALGA